MKRVYACIDLKSFYASCECVERGLDPLNTNLVVADSERTEKTICLAISPSLKQYGLGGRARLFEVVQKIKKINYNRRKNNNYKLFVSKSYIDSELKSNKNLELDYIVARPQMKKYMKYSANIYNIYLKYLSSEDIHVYSIDEVFCDLTNYLKYYKMSAKELVSKIIKDVYETTGITATGGIGPNLFLAKVSMDIVAKHEDANEYGVRIAEIDELDYRKLLWNHKPLTDFWRVGPGISKKLEKYGIYTMGDIAKCSINNEDLLYKLFGVNAELLIDHAWGVEPTTIKNIKNYKPLKNSISTGQMLSCGYNYEKAKLIIREMIDNLSLDLVNKKKLTNLLCLYIGYDSSSLKIKKIKEKYNGEIELDYYGREVPKSSHSSINLDYYTSSNKVLTKKCLELFDRIVDKNLLIKKISITACNIIEENNKKEEIVFEQLNLFIENNYLENKKIKDEIQEEKKLQNTLLEIKNKYGKNSIFKLMDLEEGATTLERNEQVGGHRG